MAANGGKPSLAKALITIAVALVAIVAISYVGNAFNGVFSRSSETVANTSWISFKEGKIQFSDGSGVRTTPESGSLTFSYEESQGIVKAVYEGGDVDWFTRISTDKLSARNGLTVFYLYAPEAEQ